MLEIVDEKSMWVGFYKDDPVRPHINQLFRISDNRKMFGLFDDTLMNCRAIVCVAFNRDVCTSENDLSNDGNNVATFYTVWSYEKGAGREIILNTVDWIKQNNPDVSRFVTLSPKTEMAKKFHLRNGAFTLQENDDTINYEYEV